MNTKNPPNEIDTHGVIPGFVAESRDLLQKMETSLLVLESHPDSQGAIADVFRAAHTIKGNAGIFGFDEVVAFTHVVESVLDEVRKGQIKVVAELIALLLQCGDHIVEKLDQIALVREIDTPTHSAAEAILISQLQKYIAYKQVEPGSSLPFSPADTVSPDTQELIQDSALENDLLVKNENWHISLRMGRDALRDGMDPLSILGFLGTLGEIVRVITLTDAIPSVSEMDPESCYLGFEIELRSSALKKQIEESFQFIRADSLVNILAPHSKVSEYIRTIEGLPEDKQRIGEILVGSGALTQLELEEGLRLQSQSLLNAAAESKDSGATHASPSRPLGEILVGNRVVHPEVVEAALNKQHQLRDGMGLEAQYIRVRADKLDRLINRVGELVIAGASANLVARRAQDVILQEATSVVSRLVEEIREDALSLRMVQIGDSFNRFQRVVHDMSRELGKDIALVISGAETELDKTVVEKIADPLMHLIRNALDHGIETEAVRHANGKPGRGSIKLNAYHDSGSIVIEVSDDGGGLGKDKILRKAIERGILNENQSIDDSEIFNLIFEPGFSTAEQVTNISGRGVGMDVVRRNIQDLRGTIELNTQEGVGTTVRIRLPLTLAIIDGFVVAVGKSAYVIPLDAVVECVELNNAEYSSGAERGFVNLRGRVLPCLHLREYFRLKGEKSRRENIVVVHHGGHHAGFVVDDLLGEFQTVIKPLGKLFGSLRGISGSTILGGGDVALIVDVPALIKNAVGGEPRGNGQGGVRRAGAFH